MGFKCPVCLKDFGLDKKAWSAHLEKEHQGAGKDMLNIVKHICEDDDQQSNSGI